MKLEAPRQGSSSIRREMVDQKRGCELVEVATGRTKAERIKAAACSTKKVSFFPQVRAQYVLHVADYSPQEHFDSWYDSFEYKEQRNEIRTTLEMMELDGANTLPENEWYTTRGLEGRTVRGSRAKKSLRRAALSAVFKAQASARDNDIDSMISDGESSISSSPSFTMMDVQDEIAQAYARVTAASTLEAHARAVQDDFEVRGESLSNFSKIHQSMPLTSNGSSAKVFISSTAA